MAYGSITVSSTATRILTQTLGSRKDGLVTNHSSTAVYIGFDNGVTTSNGVILNQYDVWTTNEPRCYQGELWGITASGTADVRYEEVL